MTTPAELRDIIGSVKAATDREARSRSFIVEVLDANPDDSAAALAELEMAVQALNLMAWLLRQPRPAPTPEEGNHADRQDRQGRR